MRTLGQKDCCGGEVAIPGIANFWVEAFSTATTLVNGLLPTLYIVGENV